MLGVSIIANVCTVLFFHLCTFLCDGLMHSFVFIFMETSMYTLPFRYVLNHRKIKSKFSTHILLTKQMRTHFGGSSLQVSMIISKLKYQIFFLGALKVGCGCLKLCGMFAQHSERTKLRIMYLKDCSVENNYFDQNLFELQIFAF